MKKNAYEDTAIKATAKRLKHLIHNCSFSNPESVKTFIANKKVSNAFKESLVEAYDIYMRSIDQKWNKPFYQRYETPKNTARKQERHMHGWFTQSLMLRYPSLKYGSL